MCYVDWQSCLLQLVSLCQLVQLGTMMSTLRCFTLLITTTCMPNTPRVCNCTGVWPTLLHAQSRSGHSGDSQGPWHVDRQPAAHVAMETLSEPEALWGGGPPHLLELPTQELHPPNTVVGRLPKWSLGQFVQPCVW